MRSTALAAMSAVLIFVVVARALPTKTQSNVAQADLKQTFACPVPPGQYQDIADLNVTLETFGGPSMLTSMLNFRGAPTAAVDFFPVIDGQASNEGRLLQQIGDFSGQVALLPFTRVYALPAGVHTFGVRIACYQVLVDRGWLTVYELPPARPGGS
jgi:hypothetical protein